MYKDSPRAGFLYASDMRQQTDINDIVNDLVNTYSGQTIAYFGSFPGESIVPVAYYVDKLRGTSPIPPMANNRADGWGTDFPDSLAAVFTHEAYQSGKIYPKGTILIWNSPHMAIVCSSDGSNTAEVFEQNSDPDGSGCGIRTRVIENQYRMCTYALIPIVATEAVNEPIIKPIHQPQMTITEDIRHILPTAPITAPSLTDRIFIVKSIPAYPAASLAFQGVGRGGTAERGNYYVYRRFNNMLNVTSIPGQSGYWINPADNVIVQPVVPAPVKPFSWMDTYQAFVDDNGNLKPKSYQVNTTITVHDLARQRKDKHIYIEQFYDMAGTFTGPDGYDYLRPEGAATAHLWYGIEPQYLTLEDELYNTERYVPENARPLNIAEQLWAHLADILSWFSKIKNNK